jgi:hypothetical protein
MQHDIATLSDGWKIPREHERTSLSTAVIDVSDTATCWRRCLSGVRPDFGHPVRQPDEPSRNSAESRHCTLASSLLYRRACIFILSIIVIIASSSVAASQASQRKSMCGREVTKLGRVLRRSQRKRGALPSTWGRCSDDGLH